MANLSKILDNGKIILGDIEVDVIILEDNNIVLPQSGISQILEKLTNGIDVKTVFLELDETKTPPIFDFEKLSEALETYLYLGLNNEILTGYSVYFLTSITSFYVGKDKLVKLFLKSVTDLDIETLISKIKVNNSNIELTDFNKALKKALFFNPKK